MKFVGDYPKTVKSVLAASAISGHNAMLLSAPGWGKTEMALSTGKAVCGSSDGLVKIELDPSTPPETVRGSYDPAALLNGNLSRITTGTPYDPAAKVVILDEVWRANDVVFDSLIHATNRKDIDQRTRPVFWGTSNFVGKGDRTEALRDRFALWVWLDTDMDIPSMSRAHLFNGSGVDPSWNTDIPSWQDCLDARSALPSQRAADLVVGLIEQLANEATHAGFVVNPRRVVQWSEIVFRNTVHATGTSDFQSIPGAVSGLLKYAYPLPDRELARRWAEVASSIADPVGASIEAYRAEALAKFRAVASERNAQNRTAQMTSLGVVLANAQSDLSRIGGDDPRVASAITEMTGWLVAAVNGKEL